VIAQETSAFFHQNIKSSSKNRHRGRQNIGKNNASKRQTYRKTPPGFPKASTFVFFPSVIFFRLAVIGLALVFRAPLLASRLLGSPAVRFCVAPRFSAEFCGQFRFKLFVSVRGMSTASIGRGW